MNVFVAVADVSRGQVVVGVALTEEGARRHLDASSLTGGQVMAVEFGETVAAGERVVAHMALEGRERVFHHLTRARAETPAHSLAMGA